MTTEKDHRIRLNDQELKILVRALAAYREWCKEHPGDPTGCYSLERRLSYPGAARRW